MNIDKLFMLSLGTDIFQFLSIQLFLKGFFGQEKVKKYTIAFVWIVYMISSNVLNNFFHNPSINLTVTLAFFFSISWIIFKASFKNSVLMGLFIMVIGMMSEVIVAIFLTTALSLDTKSIVESPRYFTLAQIYSKIVLFVLLRICYLFSKQKSDKKLSTLNWIMVLVIPFGSICLVYNTVLAGQQNMMQKISAPDIVSIIIILGINLFVFYLYDNIMEDADLKIQNQLYEQQAAYYVRQYKDYEQNNFEIRQLKHDMKNQFILLQEYIENGETNKVMEHIKQILKGKHSDVNYAQSNNLQIDAVLNYKIDYAKQYNIVFDLQIEVPSNLFVQEMDLCVILGNALDNAIEASLKLPSENRFIKVILKFKNETLYISTINTMRETSIVKMNHIPVTTKENKKQHGIGLKSIQKVIEKYNGCMEIKYLPNQRFQLELFLYKF